MTDVTPSRHLEGFRKAMHRALRLGRRGHYQRATAQGFETLVPCYCRSRGLVDEKRERCPEHGKPIYTAGGRAQHFA